MTDLPVSRFRERFERARKAYNDVASAPKQREERRLAFINPLPVFHRSSALPSNDGIWPGDGLVGVSCAHNCAPDLDCPKFWCQQLCGNQEQKCSVGLEIHTCALTSGLSQPDRRLSL
jgi:hypothetical protein